jgi:hypothetical protein
VKAAIWRNDGEYGTRYNVTFSRIFKSENGWENSTSFGRDDLPLIEKVAALAFLWIHEQTERDLADAKETERQANGRGATRAAAR